jgi:RNA recognition motif-containing protein
MSKRKADRNRNRDRDEDGGDDREKKRKEFDPSRAIYLGNVQPATATYFDICSVANEHGAIEMVKIMPQKGCAFLNFVEESAARSFFEACHKDPPRIGDQTLRVSFAKTSEMPDDLRKQIDGGASRNLFVGNVTDLVNEDMLMQLFSRFGPFENISIIRQKGIAFVNLTSIRNALAAKSALDGAELGGKRIKVNFAKEKVGLKPGSVRRPTRPFMAVGEAAQGPSAGYYAPVAPLGPPPQFFPSQGPEFEPFVNNPTSGPRGIYLGNVHADVTPHDLCKLANRFGALESVKIVEGKQCAFLNFIDPAAAQAFWTHAQQQPITFGANNLKVNWAKSGVLTGDILNAIRQGATRNLFVGNVEDHITEELLTATFKEFGELDSVVILRPKKIAFINMTSIHSSLNAREKLQGKQIGDPPVTLKINFAKEVTGKRGPRDQQGPPQGGPYGGPLRRPGASRDSLRELRDQLREQLREPLR